MPSGNAFVLVKRPVTQMLTERAGSSCAMNENEPSFNMHSGRRHYNPNGGSSQSSNHQNISNYKIIK